MQEKIINLLIPTPKLHSKKCRFLAFCITFFLKATTPIITILAWYLYDYFIAFFALILSFIIVGIIRSKLRNSSIPPKQREYQYTDSAIAAWYLKQEFCFDEGEDIS